jgi:hypothetical protein
MHWVFEGIGTSLLMLIIGLLGGFVGGWKAKGYQVKQMQTSGHHSQNVQVGRDFRRD